MKRVAGSALAAKYFALMDFARVISRFCSFLLFLMPPLVQRISWCSPSKSIEGVKAQSRAFEFKNPLLKVAECLLIFVARIVCNRRNTGDELNPLAMIVLIEFSEEFMCTIFPIEAEGDYSPTLANMDGAKGCVNDDVHIYVKSEWRARSSEDSFWLWMNSSVL